MDLKLFDRRKQGLIVLENFVNFSLLLVKYHSGYWILEDIYKGKSRGSEEFRLSFFILVNDIQITQKDTLVSTATLGVFFGNIIFVNNTLITKIDTLSENTLKVFFVMMTTASAFLFHST